MSVFLITRIKSSPAVFYAGGEKYSVRPEINEVGLFPVAFFSRRQELRSRSRSEGASGRRSKELKLSGKHESFCKVLVQFDVNNHGQGALFHTGCDHASENGAVAMNASIVCLALTQKQSLASFHAIAILAMSHSLSHCVLSTEAAP